MRVIPGDYVSMTWIVRETACGSDPAIRRCLACPHFAALVWAWHLAVRCAVYTRKNAGVSPAPRSRIVLQLHIGLYGPSASFTREIRRQVFRSIASDSNST